MNVTNYTFQSPSPVQVQVGKPVPDSGESSGNSAELTKNTDQTLTDAKNFQTSQTQEVTPKVDSPHLLDTYA